MKHMAARQSRAARLGSNIIKANGALGHFGKKERMKERGTNIEKLYFDISIFSEKALQT